MATLNLLSDSMTSSRRFPVQNLSAGQLSSLLAGVEQRKISGVLRLTFQKDPNTCYHRVIVLNQGKIVYAGLRIPTLEDIINVVKDPASGNWTKLLLDFRPASPQALLEQFVFLNFCTWDQIQKRFLKHVVAALEPVMPYGGQFELDLNSQPSIFTGLPSYLVIQQILFREAQWKEKAPSIRDWNVRPLLTASALEILLDPKKLEIHSDQRILRRLQYWLKQGGSLLEISEQNHLDSLDLAQSLQQGVNQGWIQFNSSRLPIRTLLVIDDSELMRQFISRILSKDYRILTASNAMTGLAILAQETVELLLLDVCMPGINGLELCRSIRKMGQFQLLPIIMVTGRDGLIDRVKGRISGATEYLTKPFDEEQLKSLVAHYLPVGRSAE